MAIQDYLAPQNRYFPSGSKTWETISRYLNRPAPSIETPVRTPKDQATANVLARRLNAANEAQRPTAPSGKPQRQQPAGKPPALTKPPVKTKLTEPTVPDGGYEGPVPRGVQSQGAYGNTNIYRYNPTGAEQAQYGKAIFSDTPYGATPRGIEQAIAAGGQGVFQPGRTPNRTDQYGNSLDVADSINRAVELMRQTREARNPRRAQTGGVGGIQTQYPQGRDKMGNPIPLAQQYGNTIQDILSNLPYGKAGDYRKRLSMIDQAQILSGIAQNHMQNLTNQQGNQVQLAGVGQRANEANMQNQLGLAQLAQQGQLGQGKLGLEAYKTMHPNPELIKPYVIGQSDYGSDIYSPPQIFQNGQVSQAPGAISIQDIINSPQAIGDAVQKGLIGQEIGDALMSQYFPDIQLKNR